VHGIGGLLTERAAGKAAAAEGSLAEVLAAKAAQTEPEAKFSDKVARKAISMVEDPETRRVLTDAVDNPEVAFGRIDERLAKNQRTLQEAITDQQKAARITDTETFGESKVNHISKLVDKGQVLRFHQGVRRAALGQMALVPDGQDAGDDRPRILQHLVEVQTVDVADQLDQVHVQINGVIIAATNFEVGE